MIGVTSSRNLKMRLWSSSPDPETHIRVTTGTSPSPPTIAQIGLRDGSSIISFATVMEETGIQLNQRMANIRIAALVAVISLPGSILITARIVSRREVMSTVTTRVITRPLEWWVPVSLPSFLIDYLPIHYYIPAYGSEKRVSSADLSNNPRNLRGSIVYGGSSLVMLRPMCQDVGWVVLPQLFRVAHRLTLSRPL